MSLQSAIAIDAYSFPQERGYQHPARPPANASRREQAKWYQSGIDLVSAEMSAVPGAGLGELDPRRYRHYCKRLLQEPEIRPGLPLGWSLLVGEGESLWCSRFAYALFGLQPRLRLPRAGLRVTVYAGTGEDKGRLMDEMLEGPYMPLRVGETTLEAGIVERALSLLEPVASRPSRGGKRARSCPPEAIQEALVNALVHRDWADPDPVEVAAYSDRLEITSPGLLCDGATIKAIKSGLRLTRNPMLARAFWRYGYASGQGMGISRRIIPLCIARNGRAPDFAATDRHFKVTLYKRREDG